MATDTAATKPTPSPVGPDPTTYLWQVPIFLLGAAVFVAVWQGWLPLGAPDPSADYVRDLGNLRISAEKVTADREELVDLLGKVAPRVDGFPEHAPLAHFVIGSGYARLAELTPAADEARQHWTLAKQHFGLLRETQLSDPDDWPKLAFRSTKAIVAVGLPATTSSADLRQYITLLKNAPSGEDSGEAHRLRADLAMRLSPPDMVLACEALTEYLRTTGVSTPAISLARAKLLLGDLYLRRVPKETELARKWLEQIGTDAPPEIFAQGKMLLARVKTEDKNWQSAVRDLEALRKLKGLSQSLRTASAYYLGFCKANWTTPDAAANTAEAIKLFEEAIHGPGPESIAAAARLAELYLKGTSAAKRAAVPELLAATVKDVPNAKEFKNQLIQLDELQRIFDLAFQQLMRDGAHEQTVKVVDTFEVLSETTHIREMRAEALAAWAQALEKARGNYKPKAREAAAEYEALAGYQPAATAKADSLKQAATLYRQAGEPADAAKAVEALQAALRLPQLPADSAGVLWFNLADALIAAKRPDEVWPVFNQIMKSSVPVSTAARYTLARQFIDTRNAGFVALGRALFEQIAKQETITAGEQEFHERALVELAHECIRGNNFAEAETWLRKQLNIYPTGPEASLGRLLLGVCLLQRAAGPPLPGLDPKSASVFAYEKRNEALKLFQQIVRDVDKKRDQTAKLSDRDAWLRLQAGLRVLQTYQQLQQPDKLLGEAAVLLERHRGSVEELIIRSLIYHAFKQQGKTVEMLQTRDQMKDLFERLPPTAFTAPTNDKRADYGGEYSKGYWEKVWFADK
jgi:hypothetical protein